MIIKRWVFRPHGKDTIRATLYINRMGNVTQGRPPQYTGKAHGKWRPVYGGA